MKRLLLNEVLNSQRKDQHNFDWFLKDFGRVLFMSLGTSELRSTARVFVHGIHGYRSIYMLMHTEVRGQC